MLCSGSQAFASLWSRSRPCTPNAAAASTATPVSRQAAWHSACARSRSKQACRASAAEGPVRKTLPIFPLSVVVHPHAIIPLMIFEARYRVLFNTLLAGTEGIEDGLVQTESPFAGAKRFGMCFVDDRKRLCAIGTTLEVQDFDMQPDGRMYVTNKGIERFRVVDVISEKPVLICEVEVLEEDEDNSEKAKELATEVAGLFRNVLRLHRKYKLRRLGISTEEDELPRLSSSNSSEAVASSSSRDEQGLESQKVDEALAAAELEGYSPLQLSYFIAHAFSDSRMMQQALLEENSTLARLTIEKELLEATLRFYSAATALDGVFGSSSSSSSGDPQPPTGGPD